MMYCKAMVDYTKRITFKTCKRTGVSLVTVDGEQFRFYNRANAFAFIALVQFGYKM